MIITGPIIITEFPHNSYSPFPQIVQIFPTATPQFPVPQFLWSKHLQCTKQYCLQGQHNCKVPSQDYKQEIQDNYFKFYGPTVSHNSSGAYIATRMLFQKLFFGIGIHQKGACRLSKEKGDYFILCMCRYVTANLQLIRKDLLTKLHLKRKWYFVSKKFLPYCENFFFN